MEVEIAGFLKIKNLPDDIPEGFHLHVTVGSCQPEYISC